MGIELKFTGMCEYCQEADLELVENTYNMYHKGLSAYSVECKHQKACERQRAMVLDVDKLANSFMFNTCGHCELFDPMTNYFRDGIYCVRVGTEVTYDTTACKDFVPREDKRRNEQE